MARHLRVQFEGAIYHVTVRGNARADIFTDTSERERLLERLAERVETFNIRLYLFVLMTNHFHLVFETPGANLCKFMQSLLTAYAVYFNLRHDRHGHVTEGRYKAKLVESDLYLLNLTRYVHLNPVFTRRTRRLPLRDRIRMLRQYPWSSYASYIGGAKELGFVEYSPMLAEMGGDQRQRPGRYRQFVESGIAKTDDDFVAALRESPRSIGSEAFRAWVDGLYLKLVEEQKKPGDAAFRKVAGPIPAGDILKAVAEAFGVEQDDILRRRRNTPMRGVAARLLCRYGGMTQRAVAELLGLRTGGAVSYQIRKLQGEMSRQRELSRVVGRLQDDLQGRQLTSR